MRKSATRLLASPGVRTLRRLALRSQSVSDRPPTPEATRIVTVAIGEMNLENGLEWARNGFLAF